MDERESIEKTRKVYSAKDVAQGFGTDSKVTGSTKYRDILREKTASLTPEGGIADIGCGNGLLLNKLSQKYPLSNIVGVDFSQEMIKIARARLSNNKISFVAASATNLPFKDKSFDTVTCIDTLHHLPNDELELKAIEELIRVGKNVLFEVKTKDTLSPLRSIVYKLLKLLTIKKDVSQTPLEGIVYHSISLAKITKLLESLDIAKFKILRISLAVDWRLIEVKC